MGREERVHEVHRLLTSRRSITVDQLRTELEVSIATAKRYIRHLRDRYRVPIVWHAESRTYRLDPGEGTHKAHLTGVYFNPSEVHALLTMDHLLRSLEPGLLAVHVAPLRAKLREILGSAEHSMSEIERRVRVLPMTARQVRLNHFEAVSTAVLNRKRLRIVYRARLTGERTERSVSPQRLVHYRDNWYMDAWCHLRKALRTFSIDCIEACRLLDRSAKDVPDEELNAVLAAGYGIFSGRRTARARLRFAGEQVRWVENEMWHPLQKARYDDSGHYFLEFPFSKSPELIMDLLRHVPDIEVLAPRSLRNALKDRIKEAAIRFQLIPG